MQTIFALFGSDVQLALASLKKAAENRLSICYENGYLISEDPRVKVILGQVGGVQSVDVEPPNQSLPCVLVTHSTTHNAPSWRKNAPSVSKLNQIIQHLRAQNAAQKFSQIEGDFIAIGWQSASNQLIFASSAFNPRSLFYARVGNSWLVCSDIELILQLVPPQASELAMVEWLSGRPDPNRSMYQNIHQLGFGQWASVGVDGQVKTQAFWQINPQQQIHYAQLDDYCADFYQRLSGSVANCLPSQANSPVVCQLSGGMDSTSITAITNQLAKDHHLALHTMSHTYTQTESCDELALIQQMQQRISAKGHHYVELDQFADLSFAQLYPTHAQSPGMVASPKYQQELQIIQGLGSQTLLTGNGGDEMCWGHSFAYSDRLHSGDVGVIAEVIRTAKKLQMPVLRSLFSVLVRPSLPNKLLSLLGKHPNQHTPPAPWLTRQSASQFEQIERHNPFSNHQLAKHARYEGLFYTSTFNSMRSYLQIADPLGINVHHPFMHPKVAEFSFAVPEKLHLQGRYPKYLLRKTMQDHLPEAICWNQSKTVFDQHFANLVRQNQTELRTLLSHPGLQDLGLIDNQVLLRHFDRVVNDPNGSLNVDLLYAILTQSWYQTHIMGSELLKR